MKKQIIYFALTLFVLTIFACDLDFKLPQNVQIIGSREIKLTTTQNLADLLHDQLISGLDAGQFKILKSDHGENLTYVIYMDVLPEGQKIEIPFDFTEFLDTQMVVDAVEDMVGQGHIISADPGEESGLLVTDLAVDVVNILADLETELADKVADFNFGDFGSDLPIGFNLESLISNIFNDDSNGSLADNIVAAIEEAADGGVISIATIVDVITETVVKKIEDAIVQEPLTLEDDIILPGFEAPISIPSLGIFSAFLQNLDFADEFDAQLYLSIKDDDGNSVSFMNRIKIDLAWDDLFDSDDPENFINTFSPTVADYEDAFSGDTFTAVELPGGIPLAETALTLLKEVPEEGEEKGVYIRIYLKAEGDDPLTLDFLNKIFTAKAELAIMLPLELGVTGTGSFAIFELPEDAEDILGRSEEELGGMMGDLVDSVQSLKFKIEFNKPALTGLTLRIENRTDSTHKFEIVLDGTELVIDFPRNFIEQINDPYYYPFVPDVYLDYVNASVQIPKDLTLGKIALEVAFATKEIPIAGGF